MKKILAAIAVAALTVGSMSAADARIGGSSSYTSRSTSSASRSTSSSISSGSSRIGGSMGVTNSNAMAAARAQSQTSRSFGNVSANSTAAKTVTTTSQTTTTTRTNNNYYNNAGRPGGYYAGSPGYYQRPGYSGGTVAGAALAGAAVGALAAGAGNHGTTIINNGVGGGVPVYGNGGPVYSNGGQVYAAPAVPVAPGTTVYVEHHSAFWTFFWVVVGLVVAFFVIRWLINLASSSTSNAIYDGAGDYASSSSSSSTTRTTRTTTTTVDAEEERALNKAKQLLASATQFYRQLQNANNRGDKDALRTMMTPEMFTAVEEGINERDGKPGTTTVKELRVVGDQVLQLRLDGDVYRGSIHFKGVVNEGGAQDDAVDEVFHFYAEGVTGPWKLEGIESV